MSVKKQNRDRLHQMKRYLLASRPLIYPVTVRVAEGRKDKDGIASYGECSQRERRFYIRISPLPLFSDMAHSLIHEWAHLRLATDYVDWYRQNHSDAWGTAYARIYRDVMDNGGWEESREY